MMYTECEQMYVCQFKKHLPELLSIKENPDAIMTDLYKLYVDILSNTPAWNKPAANKVLNNVYKAVVKLSLPKEQRGQGRLPTIAGKVNAMVASIERCDKKSLNSTHKPVEYTELIIVSNEELEQLANKLRAQ